MTLPDELENAASAARRARDIVAKYHGTEDGGLFDQLIAAEQTLIAASAEIDKLENLPK